MAPPPNSLRWRRKVLLGAIIQAIVLVLVVLPVSLLALAPTIPLTMQQRVSALLILSCPFSTFGSLRVLYSVLRYPIKDLSDAERLVSGGPQKRGGLRNPVGDKGWRIQGVGQAGSRWGAASKGGVQATASVSRRCVQRAREVRSGVWRRVGFE